MDRRSFMRGFAVAPIAAAAAAGTSEAYPSVKLDGLRISCEKDDPGYRQYCIFNGDGKEMRVFLNGVEQKHCMMADERLGLIKRVVITEKGNVAHANGELLTEEVSGRVHIETFDKPARRVC